MHLDLGRTSQAFPLQHREAHNFLNALYRAFSVAL